MKVSDSDKSWIAAALDFKVKRPVLRRSSPSASGRSQWEVCINDPYTEGELAKQIHLYVGVGSLIEPSPNETFDYWKKPCLEHCTTNHLHVTGRTMLRSAQYKITGIGLSVVLHNIEPFLLRWDVFEPASKYVEANGSSQKQVLRKLEEHGWDTSMISVSGKAA
jgi:hypothetical protein